jgi:4-cresol dehydrogenase (hydroxylating)
VTRLTGEAGYGLYRGHIEFMDDIAAQYDWGGHALLRLYRTLRDALDPDGILSPGKQGIWPSAMSES